MSRIIGGAKLTELYSLDSTWALVTKVLGLDQKFSTAFAGHYKSKNLVATFVHDNMDETVTNLFETYLQDTIPSTELYEDGSAAGVSDDPTKLLVAITYSGKSDDATEKRLVSYMVGQLEGGDFSYDANKSSRPTTKLTGVEVPVGQLITILATYFNSSLVTGATDKVIAADNVGGVVWLNAV